MTTVLKINSSIHGDAGQSSQLASQYIEALREREPALRVIERDLSRDTPPHLTAERFQAFLSKAEERDPGQQAAAEYSDELIAELRAADVLVIGAPMYNFGIPSQLKAWFDHVARAGVTFRYTDKGPVGLLNGKKAVVFSTRGGVYAGTGRDTETAYLRQFLAFLGIGEVEFVYAEGLAMGDATRSAGLAQARRSLQNLLQPARLAA